MLIAFLVVSRYFFQFLLCFELEVFFPLGVSNEEEVHVLFRNQPYQSHFARNHLGTQLWVSKEQRELSEVISFVQLHNSVPILVHDECFSIQHHWNVYAFLTSREHDVSRHEEVELQVAHQPFHEVIAILVLSKAIAFEKLRVFYGLFVFGE